MGMNTTVSFGNSDVNPVYSVQKTTNDTPVNSMENKIGLALAGFEKTLHDFLGALETTPELCAVTLEGTQEWRDLLTYKLVPHLTGTGCVIAAVTGGTNTGKSTVFNLLVHRSISPMVNTAAATCHPLIAANAMRFAECMEAKLIPEFAPERLTEPDAVVDSEISQRAIFIAEEPSLPDHLIIMDTPDVDSIDKRNWEVADHIRAAGDVLVAVLTGEKYKDERVVSYFREAADSGRRLLPVMNKANPANDFDVARKQLAEFCRDVGIEAECFAIAHDFDIGDDVERRIQSLDSDGDLRERLEMLDVSAIKQEVFGQTVERFVETTADFLDHTEVLGRTMREEATRFENLAAEMSLDYEPAPGKEVGGLFHEFVQSRRGTFRRYIGSASATVVRGVSTLGRSIATGFRKRTTLEANETETDESILEFHRGAIRNVTQNLVRRYIELSPTLSDASSSLVGDAAEQLDVDAAVEAILRDTLSGESISDEFRIHAEATLAAWWQDNRGKRLTLEALDTILAVMPAAIAGVVGITTGGFGAGELTIASTAAGATFGAKVMEYQFGDALFDFLSPWKKEQQALLEKALLAHVTTPCLAGLYSALEPFEGSLMDDLRKYHGQCADSQEAIAS